MNKFKATKDSIIRELHSYGETWANHSYSLLYLSNYLDGLKQAMAMSEEDIVANLKSRGLL